MKTTTTTAHSYVTIVDSEPLADNELDLARKEDLEEQLQSQREHQGFHINPNVELKVAPQIIEYKIPNVGEDHQKKYGALAKLFHKPVMTIPENNLETRKRRR